MIPLQKYLDDHMIKLYTQENIRKAVIEIRKNKLPDPDILPNSGSFFKTLLLKSGNLMI